MNKTELWNYFNGDDLSQLGQFSSLQDGMSSMFNFDFSRLHMESVNIDLLNIFNEIKGEDLPPINGKLLFEAFVYGTCLPYDDYIQLELDYGTVYGVKILL